MLQSPYQREKTQYQTCTCLRNMKNRVLRRDKEAQSLSVP